MQLTFHPLAMQLIKRRKKLAVSSSHEERCDRLVKPLHDCNIYIFIHHNMIESNEQKVQQKSTQKRKKKTTSMAQVTQVYINL